MVLPMSIGDAAQLGHRDTVIAWLDAGGSIDDVDEEGYSLVHCCACGDREDSSVNAQHVALARQLIALGADVNMATNDGRHTAIRGLAQRGKLSTDDSVLNFLARLGDNGVVWHVLEYWRATN